MEHDTDMMDRILHWFGKHHWLMSVNYPNHHEDTRICLICGLQQYRKWCLPIDLVTTGWKPSSKEELNHIKYANQYGKQN